MSNTAAVVVEDLTKTYRDKTAIKGVSFTVDKGTVFALIGPNGAGKTTTMRIMATLLRPTRGRVLINGLDTVKQALEVRKRISYLPEEAGAYPNMTGREYLEFVAKVYFDDPHDIAKAVERGIDYSGLGAAIDRKVKTYSRGMKRRLQLARALMTRPSVLILDEPTSGVDVIHAVHLRNLIRKVATVEGATVILSSHNMLEVEHVSDRVAFMHDGRIIYQGTPQEAVRSFEASDLEEAFVKALRIAEAVEGGG